MKLGQMIWIPAKASTSPPEHKMAAAVGTTLSVTLTLVIACFSTSLRAVAGEAPTATAYRGRCHSLTLFGDAISKRCVDTIVLLAAADGRIGYVFQEADGAAIAF